MKIAISILALAVLLVGAYLLLGYLAPTPTEDNGHVETVDETTARYAAPLYGISFEYPRTYLLREKEVGDAERRHYSIVLADAEALRNLPQNGEGPPAITIDVFQNNLDQLSIEEWVRGMSFSNYKLSPDGLIASTSVAGVPALSYTWDGLYRGLSSVFAHKDNILMFSVSFFSLDDQILTDFNRVLSGLDLF
ncbi:hypothetical protein HY414_00805 [Candidatus Kaiserbacteria bacterium]|nr:hypothetical protein [Candidatus Kaiserbacteria bacterium]